MMASTGQPVPVIKLSNVSKLSNVFQHVNGSRSDDLWGLCAPACPVVDHSRRPRCTQRFVSHRGDLL